MADAPLAETILTEWGSLLLVTWKPLGADEIGPPFLIPWAGQTTLHVDGLFGDGGALALEGTNAVAAARKTIGSTKPKEAEAGTIRGDLALEIGRNLVHGSDSVENGQLEVANFFTEAELVSWPRNTDPWIFE